MCISNNCGNTSTATLCHTSVVTPLLSHYVYVKQVLSHQYCHITWHKCCHPIIITLCVCQTSAVTPELSQCTKQVLSYAVLANITLCRRSLTDSPLVSVLLRVASCDTDDVRTHESDTQDKSTVISSVHPDSGSRLFGMNNDRDEVEVNAHSG